MSIVHVCDYCRKRSKPVPLSSMDPTLASSIPDNWGVARSGHDINTVCPKCWPDWRKKQK